MTSEEVYEKFGNLPLKFYNLDEYAFCFQKVLGEGMVIRAYVGGDMEKMFQTNVSRQIPITLNESKHYYAFLRQYNEDVWSESYNRKYDELKQANSEIEILTNKIQIIEKKCEELEKISSVKKERKTVSKKSLEEYKKGLLDSQQFLIESGFEDIAFLLKERFTSE